MDGCPITQNVKKLDLYALEIYLCFSYSQKIFNGEFFTPMQSSNKSFYFSQEGYKLWDVFLSIDLKALIFNQQKYSLYTQKRNLFKQ